MDYSRCIANSSLKEVHLIAHDSETLQTLLCAATETFPAQQCLEHQPGAVFNMPRPAPDTSRWAPREHVPHASGEDQKACAALLRCQAEKLESIIYVLREGRTWCKECHEPWIWYVFPTEKIGAADPFKTYVTRATISKVCKNEATMWLWQVALKEFCSLIDTHGMMVLPRIDHFHIHSFLMFWMSQEETPDWMRSICRHLGRYTWS